MDVTFPTFSRGGLGKGLASVFEQRLRRRPPLLLQESRGRQLLILCDIGGSLKGQPFETYSFLIFDLDCSAVWLRNQNAFRRQVLVHRRRMAFKALNDVIRQRALIPFLNLAEALNGVLVTFAVDKKGRPKLGGGGAAREELSCLWKGSVVERLMWIIYLGAF